MSHTGLRKPSRKQPRTKERYILDSIVSIFRGGHWVEDSVESVLSPPEEKTPQDGGGGVSAPEIASCDRTEAYLTVIGGQKYDRGTFIEFFKCLEPEITHLCVGEGRGAEHYALDLADDLALLPEIIEVNPDRYGKSARKVNVEEVLCYAIDSPLLLVGNGERVKQARAWLERTKSRREVTELP